MKRIRTLAIVVVLALAGVVLVPAAAQAADPVATVKAVTQKMSGPALPPQYAQAGWYSVGAKLTLKCYKRGQAVSGYYSAYFPGGLDNLWYKVSDGYWVADVDIDTNSNSPVTGECASGPAPATIDTNAWYSITAKNSGLRLDIRGGAKVNGTAVQQYTSNTSAAQKFRFISNGDGTYRISSALTSAQVFDVAAGATGNGAKAQTWSWTGVSQQRWFVYVSAASGYVTIKPAHASSRCLDVPGGSTKSGVQLQIYSCNNSSSQQFKLAKVGVISAVPSFRLPYANGSSVSAGAPHSNDGSASGVRNSVDFGPGGSDKAVRAIAGGTVYKVVCGTKYYLGIDHGNGWKSTYYHLTNVQSALVGKAVSAGTYLGNAGRAVPCGGSATFDHVHLSLFKSGQPYPLNGVRFGGYVVYAGSDGYYGYWNKTSGARALTINGLALCCLVAG